jgi:hypothetical protein
MQRLSRILQTHSAQTIIRDPFKCVVGLFVRRESRRNFGIFLEFSCTLNNPNFPPNGLLG